MSNARDLELLKRVTKQDEAAHRELFQHYHTRVFAFSMRRVRDESLAEEIVVDTFFEVWRRADTFRGESAVSTWIFGIAQFKCLLEIRKLGRGKRQSVSAVDDEILHRFADAQDPTERLEAREALAQVEELLKTLPEAQRQTVELALIKGMSYPDVAAQLGVSQKTVKTRVLRARTKLRQAPRRS